MEKREKTSSEKNPVVRFGLHTLSSSVAFHFSGSFGSFHSFNTIVGEFFLLSAAWDAHVCVEQQQQHHKWEEHRVAATHRDEQCKRCDGCVCVCGDVRVLLGARSGSEIGLIVRMPSDCIVCACVRECVERPKSSMWFGMGAIFMSAFECACNEHNQNSFFFFSIFI